MQSAAPRITDFALLTEIIMGGALLAGAMLARRRHYRTIGPVGLEKFVGHALVGGLITASAAAAWPAAGT